MPTPGNTAPPDEPAHSQQATPSSLIGGLSVLGVAALALGTWLAIRYAVRLTPAVLLSSGAVATGLGALIAATIVSVIAPRSATDETAAIMGSLEAIARGDLTRDPTAGSGLGPVGLALRRALAALRTSHGEVRRHARETATRADELASQLAATHVAAQRSGELAVGVSERGHALARVGERLQVEVTTLAESIDLWSHRQRADVADRMTGREQLSEITRDLNTAVETLDALGARGSVATMHLERIDESVDKIREFVSLVRKMARQSKLLSLNAAMEAARAGEQGSGFAVVAAEVRRLAKGSSDAADRTEAMLKDLLRDAGLAREAAAASQVLVAQSAVAVTRARDQVAVPAPSAEPATAPPTLNLTSVKTNVGQLALDTEGLAKLASDAKLTQGATLTRLHDLIAAAHSLNRSAARTATGVDAVRAESGEAERKTEQPASLSLAPDPHAR